MEGTAPPSSMSARGGWTAAALGVEDDGAMRDPDGEDSRTQLPSPVPHAVLHACACGTGCLG